MKRRGFLLAAATAPLIGHGILGGGLPAAASTGASSAVCRTPQSLKKFSWVAGAAVGYEVTRKHSTFWADPRFIDLLEAWVEDWSKISGLGRVTSIWSYGAHVNRCSSWHQAGRAFDIAEVVHQRGRISCRQDKWGNNRSRQRAYWKMAASLHQHFAYTLTYRYNSAHRSHIHVDNAVSGWNRSSFDPNSRVQVQMVQSACRYVFDRELRFTENYDNQTKNAVRSVQKAHGIRRPLADPNGWRAFLRATASA